MSWIKLLAYITGSVDQELLLRNEYLVAENCILRGQITGRVQLNDGERKTLAEIGKKLGRKALKEVAQIVRPDTILGWNKRLIAKKFDGSKKRRYPGRPRTKGEVERLILQFARENRSWGYDRIVGALENLGYKVSDQSVGDILRRHGIPPALSVNQGDLPTPSPVGIARQPQAFLQDGLLAGIHRPAPRPLDPDRLESSHDSPASPVSVP